MCGDLSIATLESLKQKGVAQMTEFLVGLAMGVPIGAALTYGMLGAGRTEGASVPVPEPDVVPAAGERWVLTDELGYVVTVEEVVADHVFYGADGGPMRRMPVGLFTLMYRRVA